MPDTMIKDSRMCVAESRLDMWLPTIPSRGLLLSATHATDSTTPRGPVLYLAWNSWKLAFTIGAESSSRAC